MKPKLAVGTWSDSTPRKVGKGWEIRVRACDLDGVVRQVEATGKTSVECADNLKRKMAKRMTPVKGGRIVADMRVDAAVHIWFNDVLDEGDLATSTRKLYRSVANKHVIGHPDKPGPLAHLTVSEVSVADVDNALRAAVRDGGPSVARTVRNVYVSVFDLAVRYNAIEHNLVLSTRKLKRKSQARPTGDDRDPRRNLTDTEREHLLAFVAADPYAIEHDLADLIAFAAATGVRIGEACVVTRDKIDLEAGTVVIDATLVREPNVGLVVQPFTKGHGHGDRILALPPRIVTMLANRMGSVPQNERNLIFPTPLGNLRDESNTMKGLRKVYDAAGFPWMTTHTLRGTVADMMVVAGCSDQEIAYQLGHSKVETYRQYYLNRRAAVPRAAELL